MGPVVFTVVVLDGFSVVLGGRVGETVRLIVDFEGMCVVESSVQDPQHPRTSKLTICTESELSFISLILIHRAMIVSSSGKKTLP